MAEPGWYQDQENPIIERWWNGQRWTDNTRPVRVPPPRRPSSPPALPPWYRRPWVWAWVAVVIVGGALVASRLVAGDDDKPNPVTIADPDTGEQVELEALTTPAQVAAALNAAGFECTGYADQVAEEGEVIDFGVEDPANGTGTCQHGATEISIDTYDTARHRDQARRLSSTLGCSIGAGFGVLEYTLAYGDFWAASITGDNLDRDTPAAIAAALGGKVETVDCD